MKTNVKNGIIFLGEVATDSDTIRIGDIKPSRLVTGGRFLRLETQEPSPCLHKHK